MKSHKKWLRRINDCEDEKSIKIFSESENQIEIKNDKEKIKIILGVLSNT